MSRLLYGKGNSLGDVWRGTIHTLTLLPLPELIHTPGDWQNDMKKGCIKQEGFEEGIPIWKSFSFHFWPTNPHPLGEKWTLAPYDYNEVSGMENFFLGEFLYYRR
jgi:hypothetical protein